MAALSLPLSLDDFLSELEAANRERFGEEGWTFNQAERSETDIAERGLELGVPYEHTWSCYRDEAPACGTCDSCAIRLEAFRAAGSRDPIEYAKRPAFD